MIRRSRVLLVAVVLLCVGCDQLTKAVARDHLPRFHRFSYLADTVRLEYTENGGAFLSLGARLAPSMRFWIFTVGTTVLLAVLIAWSVRQRLGGTAAFAMALVVGGALGNLIDRVANQGFVVDFLNVGLGPVRTGVFNLADVAVMAGALLLVGHSIRAERA